MRVLTIVGLVLAGGAHALAAQHSHEFEVAGFGSYTYYDPYWRLDRTFGGGGRLGFFLNDYFGLEVSGGTTAAMPRSGAATTPVRPGDFSLVLNSGG